MHAVPGAKTASAEGGDNNFAEEGGKEGVVQKADIIHTSAREVALQICPKCGRGMGPKFQPFLRAFFMDGPTTTARR